MNMQSAVEVDGFGFAGHWTARLLSTIRALFRLLRSLFRQLTSESLEATVGRAVEQAFAEFAREGCR
jgi:hypothetical protein